jgi:small multidrug resistance pump
MKAWLALAAAVALEVAGTTSLKLSQGMRAWPWVVLTVLTYGGAFAALAVTLERLPIGVTYAVWSGVGAVGTLIIGRAVFGEALGLPQVAGVALVIAGVVTLKLFATAQP